jgi:hypothetical protein
VKHITHSCRSSEKTFFVKILHITDYLRDSALTTSYTVQYISQVVSSQSSNYNITSQSQVEMVRSCGKGKAAKMGNSKVGAGYSNRQKENWAT